MHVYELHYLEQMTPSVAGAWSKMGQLKKDGLFTVYDTRLSHELTFYNEPKYWNVDERAYFLKNTQTYWNGLRHKNVNQGVFFDNSNELNQEQLSIVQKTNEELKAAIEKHGPLGYCDYDLNYKYQLRKRIQDLKRDLLEGKSIDTSKFRHKKRPYLEEYEHKVDGGHDHGHHGAAVSHH